MNIDDEMEQIIEAAISQAISLSLRAKQSPSEWRESLRAMKSTIQTHIDASMHGVKRRTVEAIKRREIWKRVTQGAS